MLAQTTVSSTNNWSYTNISPVTVQANQTYTVAVYMAGSGASYRYSGSSMFPMTVGGNLRIESSTYAYTGSQPDRIPTNTVNSHYMYGQADVRFIQN